MQASNGLQPIRTYKGWIRLAARHFLHSISNEDQTEWKSFLTSQPIKFNQSNLTKFNRYLTYIRFLFGFAPNWIKWEFGIHPGDIAVALSHVNLADVVVSAWFVSAIFSAGAVIILSASETMESNLRNGHDNHIARICLFRLILFRFRASQFIPPLLFLFISFLNLSGGNYGAE